MNKTIYCPACGEVCSTLERSGIDSVHMCKNGHRWSMSVDFEADTKDGTAILGFQCDGTSAYSLPKDNEHAALVAVAEKCGNLLRSLEQHTLCGWVDIYANTYASLAADRDAVTAALAAVRAGQPLPPAPQDQVLVEALMRIASWGEGDEVDGSFDEPCAAKTARAALAKIGIVGGVAQGKK